MNVSFYTLGCKVNQFETEAMTQLFRDWGFDIIQPGEESDVFVINSCTVTAASDKKTRNMVNRFKRLNKDSIVVLAGCYAQSKQEDLKNDPNIDIIIGTKYKDKVVEYVNEHIETKSMIFKVDDFKVGDSYENLTITHTEERTRANIKIQDGCRQFCTYCIIPYVRGPVRSREINDVLDEIIQLHRNVYKEIVLNGIHITSYGFDLDDTNLIKLIKAINDLNLNGVRYRLGSLEPRVISEALIQEMKRGDFCDHFHLSLQSGSNSVLDRMNRRYTSMDYYDKVELIRKHMPDAGITTDIIVGFPGETEKEFEETCHFVEKVRFSKVHVFPFSPREGTKAFHMPNQVQGKIKKERTNRLIGLCDQVSQDFYEAFLDRTVDVLYEQQHEKGYYIGHATNYLTTHTYSPDDLQNARKHVRVSSVDYHTLITEEVTL
ncbi:MAG: tRNA (N(6)-L-threonylcarbamoyladenosine(37)-C(2))-methylthiotransferase MtaB [Dethiosulfatibacter sp.]|nr:tRNA (N(6)-L-threonylcarbamoyladenosine(37)-C(2))-methylthiotransferase MtaB [Dethiosulfatibacter sp.]